MIIDVIIPSPGESITEVVLSNWLFDDGTYVEKDQEIGEIESDKATLPLIAPDNGALKIVCEAGESINVGSIACTIDTDAKAPEKGKSIEETATPSQVETEPVNAEKLNTQKQTTSSNSGEHSKIKVSPVAKKIMDEHNVNLEDILKGLKRLGKEEVSAAINALNTDTGTAKEATREVQESPMSPLRKKISERLVSVKNETAMLTTFNEVDMTEVMALRNKYQKKFMTSHDIKLGFMSFFTKAASIALTQFPNVNSMIDGDNIVSPKYTDIGIAVQTPKGLMVPILRNVECMSLADIEKGIANMAAIARKGRIGIEDMSGGTFTITNGGVFGSLMSTPIINPPQSAILGMHNIVERPIAKDGQVVIRPMMFIALSYDHRIIDGKDSVSFLVKIKELIENPLLMLLDGSNPVDALLKI